MLVNAWYAGKVLFPEHFGEITMRGKTDEIMEPLAVLKIFLYQWPTADIDKDHIGIPVDQLFPVDIGPCFTSTDPYYAALDYLEADNVASELDSTYVSPPLLSFIGNAADIDFGRFICTGGSGLKICNLLIVKTESANRPCLRYAGPGRSVEVNCKIVDGFYPDHRIQW